jgi:hypothetical protein
MEAVTQAIPEGTAVTYLGAEYALSGECESVDGELVTITLYWGLPQEEEFGARAMLAVSQALGLSYSLYVEEVAR